MNQSGFQKNTTIHAAFWWFKPDPNIDPIAKETMVEVNSLQTIEANQPLILANANSVTVASNILTITSLGGALRSNATVIFNGFTNASFLNGQVVTILASTTNSMTANFTYVGYPPSYGPMTEPIGAQIIDTAPRVAWLFYPQTNVSTSQAPRELHGQVASLFLYDMEALFA
jgi:hypothetical protein